MLVDLWRLLLLATGVLVAIISFIAAVRFLADGRLGPLDTLRFMLLAIPPMLAYAMPFAASFAAALAYHRFASDNELTAAYAGGVPHRVLLVPALASGLMLTAGLLALNEQVIPRFLRSMERLVTRDVTKLLVAGIDRGESIQLDNLLVHADSVLALDPLRNPPVAQAGVTEWLIFDRFVALELDPNGRITGEALARRAQLVLYPGPPDNPEVAARAWLVLEDGVRQSPEGEFFWRGAHTELGPFDVPDAFRDNPKFLTFRELNRLRDHPERMGGIDQRRRMLARALAVRDTRTEVAERLARDGRVVFTDQGGRSLTIHAAGLQNDERGHWLLIPQNPGSPILVEVLAGETPGGRPRTERRAAQSALIRPLDHTPARHTATPGAAAPDNTLAFRLELTQVTRTEGDTLGDRGELPYDGLRLENDPLEKLLALNAEQLINLADDVLRPFHDPFLAHYRDDLRNAIDRLGREITSKQHERWAMAASVLVMIACGSTIAMLFAQSMPLPVYLATFFPALAAYLTISTGQRMVHNAGNLWLLLLWLGILALGALGTLAYARLRRH